MALTVIKVVVLKFVIDFKLKLKLFKFNTTHALV